MTTLCRLETLAAFFAGMAVGLFCTLHDKLIGAEKKSQKEAKVVERVYSRGPWELWYYPGQRPPLSRETRHYIENTLERKLLRQWRQFEYDYLFEQFGEQGKPKGVDCKIWSFRQALHAAIRTYRGCPPDMWRFPELRELGLVSGLPAWGPITYYVDGLIHVPADLGDFAKTNDPIYVVGVDAWVPGFRLSNWLWVNARTGEVAALFPVSKPDILLPGTRVLLEPPKKN